jgi:hypothetical protein
MESLRLLALLASATAVSSGARFRVNDESPGENWTCAPLEDPQAELQRNSSHFPAEHFLPTCPYLGLFLEVQYKKHKTTFMFCVC